MSLKNNTFEYKKEGEGETPFSTFLRYSDEKLNTSKKVAEILIQLKKDNLSILDIGGGDGFLLKESLVSSKITASNIIIVDPNKDILDKARDIFSDTKNVTFIEEPFETWNSNQTFDIVLASHLYHIESKDLQSQYASFFKKVAPGGVLIFIMRKVDDVFTFKTIFKKKVMGQEYVAQTIDQAITIFESIVPSSQIKRDEVYAKLSLPYKESRPDTDKILSFLLSKKVELLEEDLVNEMYDYLEKVNGELTQIDGILLVKNKIALV